MNTEILLSIEQLRVDFPGVVAVDDLSLTLHPGEIYALIGPNGAGKTSTLRAIAGLGARTRGKVAVGGFDLDANPEGVRANLGFMPDFSPVYDLLTVHEFLEHFGLAYRVPNLEERIDHRISLCGLNAKKHELCRGLSRGMKQRLILAKTLLPDPPLLLLDEPAAGLDPNARIELKEIILSLRDAGKAVIISSHILTELSAFCNYVGIMERGKLKYSGSIEALTNGLSLRPWRLRWRESHPDVENLLNAQEGIRDLVIEGQAARFMAPGDGLLLDRLLGQLVQKGVRVSEWGPHGDALENLFVSSGVKDLM